MVSWRLSLVGLLAGSVMVLIMLAPRGVMPRWLLPFLAIPLFWPVRLDAPLTVQVLDVGQGLSVVLRTANHTLVYDAGPAFEGGFDAGSMVVVPYLRSLGFGPVDRYVQSHGDLDHRGGSEALRRELIVVDEMGTPQGEACQAGRNWRWDGVTFEVLHPSASGHWGSNNASCVLKVSAASQSILLTGDIERAAELALIQSIPEKLKADILLAPHHGSATSSSMGLLNTVSPQLAIISAGWRNRWGFPKPVVVRRYEARDIQLFNTADSGALMFRLGADFKLPRIIEQRQMQARFWHAD